MSYLFITKNHTCDSLLKTLPDEKLSHISVVDVSTVKNLPQEIIGVPTLFDGVNIVTQGKNEIINYFAKVESLDGKSTQLEYQDMEENDKLFKNCFETSDAETESTLITHSQVEAYNKLRSQTFSRDV